MNTILRAADSAEFLGLVPALAGFAPRQSLVLVPFRRSRASGAMRVDLPDGGADLGRYVSTAFGLFSRVSGADAIALVVYTDDGAQATPDGLVLPQTAMLDELLSAATADGLRIVDALCVMPGGWSSYLDDDPVVAPLAGIPVPEEVAGVGDVSGDQHAGTELPRIDLAEKERVALVLRDLTDAVTHDWRHDERRNPQAIAASILLDDLTLLFEEALDAPENMPPFVTAALLWCFERPRFRDVAMLQWATDLATGARSLAAQLAYADNGTPIPDEIGLVLMGIGRAPDPDRLRIALTVVRNLAARAPSASRPAALTIAAWLSWALGRSTHAAHYLQAVAEIDPDYSMAALIGSMIDAAVLPEWTFRQGAAS
ncbi:DUF4192 family protein [uncultured Microbacterium sp.]|uniref:DUF4192 family protein n=1 Tax=uncultured Microbacterium sp. TaxID=191216 RepID=UPI00260F4941|nr:DUF4192 family protein [uncultured Microbacterium sp.]